jgi:cytochrome P450
MKREREIGNRPLSSLLTPALRHDTVSSSLAWAFYELGLAPEMQAEAAAEVDRLFSDADGSSLEVDGDRLRACSFLEAIFNETRRLHPTVPYLARRTAEDVPVEGTGTIPSGTTMMFHVYTLHTRRDIWGEDAMRFRPSRFLDPDGPAHRDPYAYVPFAVGVSCRGETRGGRVSVDPV